MNDRNSVYNTFIKLYFPRKIEYNEFTFPRISSFFQLAFCNGWFCFKDFCGTHRDHSGQLFILRNKKKLVYKRKSHQSVNKSISHSCINHVYYNLPILKVWKPGRRTIVFLSSYVYFFVSRSKPPSTPMASLDTWKTTYF